MISIKYVVGLKTNGANPFKIFESIPQLEQGKLRQFIKAMPYDCFLKSSYWFAVSSVAKSRAGMRCQVCNCGQSLNVHHRTYDSHGREHEHMNDLVVLCENCHGLFHGHLGVLPEPIRVKEKQVRPMGPREGWKTEHADSCPIPDCDPVVLTHELVTNLRTNGAFTNATLRALGMTRDKMTAGWPARLVGETVSLDAYKAAAEGRYHYGTGRLPQAKETKAA